MDEHVTVIKGVFRIGFGSRFDAASMHELPAGSYVMLPKEAPHYNLMKGEAILQFHGIGPYDISYVNAADDATDRTLWVPRQAPQPPASNRRWRRR
jgi:hypothetical protein